jgi:hypothetical protein
MKLYPPFRLGLGMASAVHARSRQGLGVCALLAAGGVVGAAAITGLALYATTSPAFAENLRVRQAQVLQRPKVPPPRPAPRPQQARPQAKAPAQNDAHIQQWMEQHRNLSPAEQQRALDQLPGFSNLPAQTQQRLRDRLAQLNTMPAQQRDRMLQYNEQLERRTPQQQAQFRSSMQFYNGLPPARKLPFGVAFRSLREMPPAQREEVINSARFRAQFSDPEREALSNILAVEPYPPVGGQR